MIIFKEHIAYRTEPKNLLETDRWLFSQEFEKKINATNLKIVAGANLFSDLIFSNYGFSFHSKYAGLNQVSFKQKLKVINSLFKTPLKISQGVWITDEFSKYYFHWLTDALPRVVAAEKYLDGHLVLLPKAYESFSYIKESLELLNYKAIFFEVFKRVHINELLLPSHTAPTGNYNKELVNSLRNRFISEAGMMRNKKIYISRRKAVRRKILNETEVIELLKSFDYEIHYFEDYNFKVQVEIAGQATHLVSLHGAGLTNMLFMQQKGKILELRNQGDNHNNCYFSLASDLDHDYYYLLCKGDNADTLNANFLVNINHLRKVIEEMI